MEYNEETKKWLKEHPVGSGGKIEELPQQIKDMFANAVKILHDEIKNKDVVIVEKDETKDETRV